MFELVTGIKSLSTHFATGDTDNDSFFDLHSTALGEWLSMLQKCNTHQSSIYQISLLITRCLVRTSEINIRETVYIFHDIYA